MSDDINMQRERLSEAAAKSEQPTSDTPKWTPKVGDWFILKASYCHGDNAGCTEAAPCERCLKACNRFVIGGMYHLTAGDAFFFAPTFCNRDGGCYMDSTHCSVLTDNEKVLKEFGLYAHRISEAMPIPSPDLAAAKAELQAEKEAYETLTGLLNERFPPNKDGLPDFKVEDVLRENAELRKRPTMEEVQAYCKAWYSGLRHQVCNNDHYGLAAFIEQQRRKEG